MVVTSVCRFWLGKVVRLPWVPHQPLKCAVSDEEFSIGEPVLEVLWYDRYPEYEGRSDT